MASFAELDENNVVLRVVAIHNNELLDENGVEQEAKGIAFCQSLFGGRWLQTSYNCYGGQHRLGGQQFRKNHAGIGFTYDVQRDAFIPPKPDGVDWAFDEEMCVWRNLPIEQALEDVQIGVTRV